MTPGEEGSAVSLVATVCGDRDCELCGGEKVSDEINEGVQVNRIVTPWDKRAVELRDVEGAYCHYAAWLEWFESWNAKQSDGLELELDELERTMLYQAFCDACSECVPMPITATLASLLPNQDGWVSVDIQLPPDDVPVWLHGPRHTWIGCRTHVVGEGWFWAECGQPWIKDGKWTADVADIDDYEATHWMPLPTLPVA